VGGGGRGGVMAEGGMPMAVAVESMMSLTGEEGREGGREREERRRNVSEEGQ